MSAALAGAGMGLGLGAIYLMAGMGHHAAEHQRATRIAEAAVSGYDAAYVETVAPDVGAAQARYVAAARPDAPRRARSAATRRPTRDLECLTAAVYYEARGESPTGQFAVAQVVMNRVRHRAFPKSVCGVVFQGAGRRGCQFSFACDGSMRGRREASAWKGAQRVARRALSGAAIAEVGAATHFHTTGVSPAWGPRMRRVAQVGMHVFYRFAPRTPSLPAPVELVENAVLIATPDAAAIDLTLTPIATETQAVAPAQPAAPAPAEAKAPQPAPAKPAEAATLTAPQPASAAGS